MDYFISNVEIDTKIHENEPVKKVTEQQTAELVLNALIIEQCHLMKGIAPEQAGCRHLIKEAYNVINQYDRVVIEHEDADGKTVRRVIKDFGNSVEPFYTDLEDCVFDWEITPEGKVKRLP